MGVLDRCITFTITIIELISYVFHRVLQQFLLLCVARREHFPSYSTPFSYSSHHPSHIAFHCTVLFGTILCCAVLLYCTVLFGTVLHCTVLCCTALQVASSSLFCRRWVDTLLALLGSSWDRTRSLAYAILSRFPRPLAGYEGHKGAAKLSSIGLRLAGSGRQRESDKGALILRLVFVSYAMGLGLRVPLLAYEYQLGNGSGEDVDCESAAGKDFVAVKRSSDGEDEMVKRDVTACFLEGLCDVLKHRWCIVI